MAETDQELEQIVQKWLAAGVLELFKTREDGTREYVVLTDEPRKDVQLVVYPEGGNEGEPFSVKIGHYRDRNHDDPLGDTLLDLDSVEALDAWLDEHGLRNLSDAESDLNPDSLAQVVDAVERHLGDVVEDPDDTAAVYEEAWTIATDACQELGIDNEYAKKALEQMGISAPAMPEITLSEVTSSGAELVRVITAQGEDEVDPSQVKVGDVVELPDANSKNGEYVTRYRVVEDPMKNESEMLDQLVGGLLEEVEPEPEPQLRPFTEEDWMTYGGADRPEGSEPLIGEIDLGATKGDIIVDRNGVGIHAFGPNEEQIFFYHPTPFAQGRGIAAQVIRAHPDINKLSDFGFERVV